MDGRKFEDNINIHELMTLPQKELMAMMYVQTLKTNGAVAANCQEIMDIKTELKDKADKTEITDIKDEVKDKIGTKLFSILAAILGVIITGATIAQFFIGR